MYGGSGKMGRGGGGGNGRGGKRSSFPPPPSNRSSAPPGGRLSLGNSGGPRNQANTNSVPSVRLGNQSVDENFSLVSGKDPPAFAMIIRLTPDLVDEIIRAEAQGGAARIKFDANANNTSGNVIDLEGKDFRFTWSSEMGDLYDIYEERQSGEDGSGLLVESGCAWRKLNVQRILDESTTNHVKMRSEEAKRKHKSRKAIILDPANPSMKNQMKALAAAESNPWRMPFKQKKESAGKKSKFEPSQVLAPSKTAIYKSGGTSISSSKGRPSASPVPSAPDQSITQMSSIENEIITKNLVVVDNIIPTPALSTSKETIANFEKEIPSRVASTAQGTLIGKGNIGAVPMDLQSTLISLLMDNPKGMNLKALERAVGDTNLNSTKKIEPLLKKIANFQAPGRYILKPGIELENSKKPLPESRSSPGYNRHQVPTLEDNHDKTPALEPSSMEKLYTNAYSEETQLNSNPVEESTKLLVEKIDIQHQQSPNPQGEKKVSDNSGNSGSDSDSESDTSDSGSDSQSKSKSPVGSGSGSSSDSDSDASSNNSKEGSDVDVDIMTSEDDKEPKHKPDSAVPLQHEIDEMQDDHGFAAVEIERIFPNDHDTESVPTKSYSPPNHDDYQERQNFIVSLFDEKENLVKEGFRHEQSNSSENNSSKNKSKRGIDFMRSEEKSENAKRLKTESSPRLPTSRLNDDAHKFSNINLNTTSDMVTATEYDCITKAPNIVEKHGKHVENLVRGPKYSGKNSETRESFRMQEEKPYNREGQDEDTFTKKRVPRNTKEASFSGRRSLVGNFKETEMVYNSHVESSPKGSDVNDVCRSPAFNGRNKILRREVSDLELGELRDPMPDESLVKKQFERKRSFKQSESKANTADTWNSDSVEHRSSSVGAPSNPEAIPKKKSAPKHYVEDKSKPQVKATQSQPHHLTIPDHAEIEPHSSKLSDLNGKFKQGEHRTTEKKDLKLHDSKRRPQVKKENRVKQPSITFPNPTNGQMDIILPENNNFGQKGRESSSDETSCSYSKYEKDQPELKGPIQDFSQYKEYVQEYRDKYDSYCSLDKTLEIDRNHFLNLGKNLEFSKGKDMDRYYNLLAQLKDSYHQYGPKHKRLKSIFVVLHEELKMLKQRIKDFAIEYTKD